MIASETAAAVDPSLSLFQLLDPAVHADPYPFYRKLREDAPVHWDAFMQCWVVTRYDDVLTVLQRFSADRTPDPARMAALGLPSLAPVADVMARQMLFLDAPDHTRLRKLCASAFTPRRVEAMEAEVRAVAHRLIDAVAPAGRMDVIADFAEPFPAIVTAGLLGVPLEDHRQLKTWSADFAEMLGNFQHNLDRIDRVLATTAEMTNYFRAAVRAQQHTPREGLIRSLMLAEVDGARLNEDEVIANVIVTMVGGQETTTNLIGNGLLTLLRQPHALAALRDDPALMPTAVEELLRYETPSQHTGRIAPEDIELGGHLIRKGQAVMAVMAAGNRDPDRFPDPDRLDLARTDNRHLAFGWSAHFCFGAPLARMEGRIAFEALLARLPGLALADETPLVWRSNSGLRGLVALPRPLRSRRGVTLREGLSDDKRRLFEQMMRGEAVPATAADETIARRAPDTPVPLTAAQRQVWLHAAMAPDAPLYNESITIHRLGPFDRGAMQAAVDGIVARHEAWRTAIVEDGSDVVQIVHPPLPVAIAHDDVGHLPLAERDAAALAIAAADARRPIDLAAAPLFRARIVRLSDEEHRLYLTLHHIIFDGVSIYRIIVPELAALYEAHVHGRPAPLAEVELGYGDFAVWQQERLDSAANRRQIAYWRRTLDGAPSHLDLPGDHSRPALSTRAGSMAVFELPGALVDRLKALARAEGATLYMTLLAGFKAMLMRYSGAEDIVIGGVTDLRRRPELASVVGYFLNTMALRSRPHPGLPFRAFLSQVRDAVLGALDASEVPFDAVVRALDLPRRAGTHPLFNVLFSIEPPVDPFPPGWDLTQMDVVVGTAKFDLYLELDERPDGMIARFLYSTEVFEPATIRRMTGHWLTMLDGIVAAPETPLGRLPMLSADETATMLGKWNDTARPRPATSVPVLIAEQARRHPDAAAVRIDGVTWSYAALEARADAIAARLHAAGVGRGALIGVALDRSFDMIAALVAILRMGAAYLPLDPGFPRARLDAIVADAAPAALLTSDAVALPDWPLPRILVDGPAAPPAPTATIADDDLAYVLYTSGSSGAPKGVEIGHGALTNLLLAMRDAPGFAAGESLLAVTTLSFDIAALELLLPLIAGGTVILAPRTTAADPEALAALIATERPHAMQATPATWRALVEAGWPGDPRLRILCGGEAMPRALAGALLPRCAQLWNLYGPTETTIWSLIHQVTPGDSPVPIGRPIANTVLAILDASDNPVPIGVTGELNIGGLGVARGYRGRAEHTAERFRETSALPGVRLYRTGDRARYLADGTVVYLGRADAEEKIRGYRVAVEEIESALVRLPGVAAAAVRGWPDPTGNRALATYLVLRDTAAPTLAEVRAALATTLPDYMLPASLDTLPALPMTANAKIDRKALPAPARTGPVAAAEPPRGPVEQRLAAIWRDILGVEQVARHDSFFDLGGHSLLVARLLRRIERDFAKRVDMAGFFRAHRLADMAGMLASGVTRNDGGFIAVQPEGDRPPLLWLDAGPTFVALARAIGLDQPMLGVAVDPILARTAMPYCFEDIAAQVVTAIRAVQPDGPYYIGGWCTSGILAFEVAHQLHARGATVPLLVLAHAMNPTEFERIGWLGLRIAKLRFHTRQWLREGRGHRLRYAAARAHAVLEEMRLSRKRVATGTHGALRAALDTAAYAYVPPRYAGAVALFQPHERVAVLDGVPGWARVIDGTLEAHDIAGGHRSMLEAPHVAEFGSLLRAALTAAQETGAAR